MVGPAGRIVVGPAGRIVVGPAGRIVVAVREGKLQFLVEPAG